MSDHLLLGESPAMDQLRADIQAASRSSAAILIEGETGVGKDVTARLIHDLGWRKSRRFVAVNCAGLPDSLLESELFGHVRGSFTGAYRDKTGLAALAHGGTLFLDEVGEMSPRMQAVLLRFTESGEMHPVGSDRAARSVDVRLISATNRPLAAGIASGTFRADLYYRLNVIRLVVPPLRERRNDVLTLLRRFLNDFAQLHQTQAPEFTATALEALVAYSWPGNVRELKNLAEQIVVKGADRPIEDSDLPTQVFATSRTSAEQVASGGPNAGSLSHPAADRAWDRMVQGGETFWTAVYDVFIDRELTKTDVRQIVTRGLRHTQGSYRQLATLFHLTPREHKRFLAFLYHHDCRVTVGPVRVTSTDHEPLADAGKTA